MVAFNRISASKPIRIRAGIAEPNVAVVLDATVLRTVNVTDGLAPGGTLVINSRRPVGELDLEFGHRWRIASVDASRIALEVLGVPIVNTVMLGTLLKATGLIKAESLVEPLQERFGRLAERNIKAMNRALGETQVGGLIV